MVRTRVFRLVVSAFCAAGYSGWITAQTRAAGIVTFPALAEGLVSSMAIGQQPCINRCPCTVVAASPPIVLVTLDNALESAPGVPANATAGTALCWTAQATDTDKVGCACDGNPPDPQDGPDDICGYEWIVNRGNELVGYRLAGSGGSDTFCMSPNACGTYTIKLIVHSCVCDDGSWGPVIFQVTGANGEGPGLGDCGAQGGQNCSSTTGGGTIGVDKGVLPGDGQSTAQASHTGSGTVCWSLVGDTHGATIDPMTGEITSGHEEGWLTIRASDCNDPNCFEEIQVWQSGDDEDCKGCQESGCVEGSARIGLSSIDVAFSLGTTLDGKQVGFLSISEQQLSGILRTPAALKYPHTPDVTVIRDSNGNLRQLRAPKMLADILTWSNPTRYQIVMYGPNAIGEIGTDGTYTVSSGFHSGLWECTYDDTADPANPTFTVRMSSNGPGQSDVTYVFSEGSGPGDMEMAVSSANGIYRQESMRWLVPGVRKEHVILDGNGVEISRVEEAVVDNGSGGQMIAERIVDSGGLHRTTTYQYYPATAPAGKPGRLKSVVDPDGSWAWYDYDDKSRQTLVIRAWKGVSLPATGDPDPALARATYSDVTLQPFAIELPKNCVFRPFCRFCDSRGTRPRPSAVGTPKC